MTRDQLIRRLRALARRKGVNFEVDRSRGKGSHWIICFEERVATAPHGEIAKGTLQAIFKQLHINSDEL